MNCRPFTVNIDRKEIDNLRTRLDLTRWPDEILNSKWEYGIPLDWMKEMASYWRNEFDWRKVEASINSYPNFKMKIDGLDIHYVHVRGSGLNPMPILIPHGWPSTFYEMLDLIPYLTHPERYGGNPEDSFDVVIPSVPGHGFSDIPALSGFEDRRTADILVKLMRALGYNKFASHGYDLGASILGLLCLDHPEHVIGYHTTSPGNPSPFIAKDTALSEAERAYLDCCKQWYNEEGGYAHLLGTKPQTIAYSLHDSPVGLAAFILEKWYIWTSPPSTNLDQHFSKESLLANVSLYWFTQTINASNRFYFEGKHTKWPDEHDISQVPIGVALTATQAHERPPREYVERMFPNILSWEELNTGGHFVAAEQPQLLAEKIRAFFSKLR
ncbi:epoxide hydrolase [Paenibacillus sp. SC116]|uniref:epoxide hydrolase family protein n=1 Tax=Paenibacillus sp. SC116 TaxID=2968986 RepID=UPI00215A399B|nr:epoxide hydrolase family protein [Paenibacillus sp. SC116]MCR8844980.1 epoxide hydrolase [Paenibacillus sp. SC116]